MRADSIEVGKVSSAGSGLPDDVAIVGVVRNCAGTLRNELGRLANAFAFASQIRWFLVESDSTDATVRVLEQAASEFPDFQYASLGRLSDSMPSRTQRIAHCRNLYLDALRNKPELRTASHVVIADLDGVNDKLTIDAVLSCFQREDWDAVFANQGALYYDIWALRHPLWSPNDWIALGNSLRDAGFTAAAADQIAVEARMIHIPDSAPWIAVDSAFGGLGIYRREVLLTGAYVGISAAGKEQCEHVSLHEAMRASGARLWINPALINTDWAEHAKRLRAVRVCLRQFKRWLVRCVSPSTH